MEFLRLLIDGFPKAFPWLGSSAAAVSGNLVRDPAGEMEHRILKGQDQRSTPPSARTTGTTTSGQDEQFQRGWGRTISESLLEKVLGLHGRLRRVFRAAISVVKLHIINGTCSMLQLNAVQSEDHGEHLKRLIEYMKKAIPFESLVMAALSNHPYYNSTNTAFFTDTLSASLLHLKSLEFLIKHLVYTSSVTQMLMPFFLFVSSGQLRSYMILVVSFPFLSITLFHGNSLEAGAATDASALDHNFDISAWICAISSGVALIGPNPIKFVAASFLACSQFLTMFIARYLMLISTLRPAVVISHVETLMNILKLFCELTVILFILDRFGWRAALVATSVIIMDAVLLSLPSLLLAYYSPTSTDGGGDEPIDLWRNQQLLSAPLVSVLFVALTQTYSEHVKARDNHAPLGPAATWRLLLYFGAFVWSLNRLLIKPGDVRVRSEGGHNDTVVTVWSALERGRAAVVLAALVDIIYKISIAFIKGSS